MDKDGSSKTFYFELFLFIESLDFEEFFDMFAKYGIYIEK